MKKWIALSLSLCLLLASGVTALGEARLATPMQKVAHRGHHSTQRSGTASKTVSCTCKEGCTLRQTGVCQATGGKDCPVCASAYCTQDATCTQHSNHKRTTQPTNGGSRHHQDRHHRK